MFYYQSFTELETDKDGSIRTEYYNLIGLGLTPQKYLSVQDGLPYDCIHSGFFCVLRSPTHQFFRTRLAALPQYFSKID
jgi:hypothetical protein